MNLFRKLLAAEENGKPVRIGMVGAGKLGTMLLAQALRFPGIHLVVWITNWLHNNPAAASIAAAKQPDKAHLS